MNTAMHPPALRALGVPPMGRWNTRPVSSPYGPPKSPVLAGLLQSEASPGSDGDPATRQGSWGSPPRRPTSANWVNITNERRSTRSDSLQPLQPAQTVVEIVDSERGDSLDGESDEARQLAKGMGAERLYDVFRKRYGVEGVAPLEALPELFEVAGLPVPEAQLEAALAKAYPDAVVAGNASYPQCQDVFLLLQTERRKSQVQDEELGRSGRFSRWVSSLSDKDATNLLLVVVVVLCALSAFLAAGVAIALFLFDGISKADTRMQEDLGIVQDSLEVYASQLSVQEVNNQTLLFVTTLSSICRYFGYNTAITAATRRLQRAVMSIAVTLSAWWGTDPQHPALTMTSLGRGMSNASLTAYGVAEAGNILAEVGGGLPVGFEYLLGRWLNAIPGGSVEYLTKFRYACPNNTCTVTNVPAAPMMAALSGQSGTLNTVDYRNSPVFTGYNPVNPGLGVQFKIDATTLVGLRITQLNASFSAFNAAGANNVEFILAYMPLPTGAKQLITPVRGCDATCSQQIMAAGTPMGRALAGQSGTTTYVNFRGVPSLAAFGAIGKTGLGLVLQMPTAQVVLIRLMNIATLIDKLNGQFADSSQEFELASFKVTGNTTSFTHLTAYRFAADCPAGQCANTTQYLRQAAANCSNTGVLRTTDYRNKQVVVGYTCIAEMSVVLSLKMDADEAEAEVLSAIVEAIDDRSAKDNTTSAQFLVATPNDGLTATDVHDYGDFTVRSALKYPNQCVNPNCTWNRRSALLALEDQEDVADTTDYRAVSTRSAPTRSYALSSGIGVALEMDRSEVWQPLTDTALVVGGFAIGMVGLSTIVLVAITKVFLRSMINAKEEGKKAVETEKDRFSKLVSSMYPKYVVPQLLRKEKQMVCEVPGAAVFFSDMHDFTATCNTLPSQELLSVMGYVYGVMDHIADRFGVYKVKTFGDAYLAVLGLPGSNCENPCLELLRFASFVCQVFGDRFIHPPAGQVLALMNTRFNVRLGKQRAAPRVWPNSRIAPQSSGDLNPPSTPGDSVDARRQLTASNTSSSLTESVQGDPRVYCSMTYG
eukprot:EG_transcript_1684